MQDGYQRLRAFYNTPNLWKGKLLGLNQFYLDKLRFDQHDLKEGALTLPDIPHGTVLGKRAEFYFKFCVDQSSNYNCLLSNIQVFRGKTTLGELDFIVQHNTSRRIFHIELVYKFYIYDPTKRLACEKTSTQEARYELSCYEGPNRRDYLLKKINRLKTHQLPLLYRPETKSILEKNDIDVDAVEQKVCFLAQVFIPCDLWNHNFKWINKACIKGYYLNYSAFAKAETQNDTLYFIPHKHQWKMNPFEIESQAFNFSEILLEVKKSIERGFAPLLWKKVGKDWERFFVIAD
ncbi:hypothetical protein BST97_02710 [Nonlabens spongiae]|uniref:DUF1853 domain-containing protein n=1 Tax=Nonlabens spongiae TaxID=331648 RepID=A0A1W6MHL1_9FLAO|nr:DUF1853 family protein [Nonlabens spongiae]ARN76996.1 hypothetical protein BST97_02710 [Nonlabens spongiae]